MESSTQCYCQCLSSVVPVAVSIKCMPEQVLEELLPAGNLHPSSPLTLWKGSHSKASPILHPVPAWTRGQLLELCRGACFPRVSRNHICSTDGCSADCWQDRLRNSVFTLAHSTLPASLRGGAWKVSCWAHGDGAVELLPPPACCNSPVNAAARGTNRKHTMQTALTSHAFSGKYSQKGVTSTLCYIKCLRMLGWKQLILVIYTVICIHHTMSYITYITFIYHPISYLYRRHCMIISFISLSHLCTDQSQKH